MAGFWRTKLFGQPTDCRSVRLRSRFLLNSFWRQLLTHYKARTEALCESIEKSPIDVNGSKARGTFPSSIKVCTPQIIFFNPKTRSPESAAGNARRSAVKLI